VALYALIAGDDAAEAIWLPIRVRRTALKNNMTGGRVG
jgi:hypothetical protein